MDCTNLGGEWSRGFETFFLMIGFDWFKSLDTTLKSSLENYGILEQAFQYNLVSSKTFCNAYNTLVHVSASNAAKFDLALAIALDLITAPLEPQWLMSTEQFCKAALNLDIIRGLDIEPVKTTDALDEILYELYNNGEVVQTKLMKKRKEDDIEQYGWKEDGKPLLKSIGYRHQAIKRDLVSYGFNEEDEKNGIYDYTVYVNDSGTPEARFNPFDLGIGDLGPEFL